MTCLRSGLRGLGWWATAAWLAACSLSVPGPDHPPRADTGPDVVVPLGSPVLLDGSRSRAPDGDALEFRWRLMHRPFGSDLVLPEEQLDQPALSFTPDLAGTYLVALEVRALGSGAGGWSPPDVVQIRAVAHPCVFDADCDDGRACTQDRCVEGLCAWVDLQDGAACGPLECRGLERGEPACQAGDCAGWSLLDDCDDLQACTGDTCDPAAGCGHAPLASGEDCGTCAACDGAGLCLADLGQHLDCPACQRCVGLGLCDFQPAGADLRGECGNGLYCDGTEGCDGRGACAAGTPPCPAGACDEGQDRCACAADAECPACERCALGACEPQDEGQDLKEDCPSGDCLVGACDGQSACGRLAAGTPCTDNGAACDGTEVCDDLGACVSPGDPCSGAECQTCQPGDGSCADPAGSACTPDAVDCTLDQCDGLGACGHPPDDPACELVGSGQVCRPDCAADVSGCVEPPDALALECQPARLASDQASLCTARLEPAALEGCLACQGLVGPVVLDRTDFGDAAGTCEANGWRLVTGPACEDNVDGDCEPAAQGQACCADFSSVCVRTPEERFYLRSDKQLNCGGNVEEWRLVKVLDTRGLRALEVCFWTADVGGTANEALGLRVADLDGADFQVAHCLHDGPQPAVDGVWYPVCAPLPDWAAGKAHLELTFVAHSGDNGDQLWLDEITVLGWTESCEPDRQPVFAEDFEGCPTPAAPWNGWSVQVTGAGSDNPVCHADTCRAGSLGLQSARNQVTLERRLDLSSLDGDVRLCFRAGDHAADTGESLRVSVDVGLGFREVWAIEGNLGADDVCGEICLRLDDLTPRAVRNPDVGLRFVLESDNDGDQVFVDDVRVDGARYCPAPSSLLLATLQVDPGILVSSATSTAGLSLGGLVDCAWGEPADGLGAQANVDFVLPEPAGLGYAFRRRITFDNLGRAEELRDFPVPLVLRADPSGNIDYSVCAPGGADLLFLSASGREVLAHEIERWNPDGVSIVWVRVPRIAADSDSSFVWMYYGGARPVTSENAAGVWERAFLGVWHLAEAAGAGAFDSTAGHLDGVYTQGPGLGQDGPLLDGAAGFDGNDDRVLLPNVDVEPLDVANGITLEAVAVKEATGGAEARLVSKANGSAEASHWWMLSLAGPDAGDQGFKLRVRLKLDGTTHTWATAEEPVSLDSFFHAAATYDGANVRIYCDGQEIESWPATGLLTANATIQAALGNNPSPYGGWSGRIADVRISRTARSAAWISAAHQAWFWEPRPFVRYGDQETLP